MGGAIVKNPLEKHPHLELIFILTIAAIAGVVDLYLRTWL